jgi:DNA polymerase III subunit delta
MTVITARQADSFLRTFDPRFQAILLFGPDAGLVSERARAAAQRLADASTPPGEILRIEDSDLESAPDRLVVELQTVAMFGGRKVVRTTASRRVTAQALNPLLKPGVMAGALVLEAGSLKADDPLRALFEKPDWAAAIACYADDEQSLDAVVRQALAAAKLDIAPEARQLLVSRLGADRALSRGEIEKLVLYARGKPRIEVDDVDAVVGDASELTLDKIVFAAASGDGGQALFECDRALSSGENAQTVVSATQRHFQRLHRLRAATDAGRPLEDALRQLRPPVYFKQKARLELQCRMWNRERLDEALSRIARTAKMARRNATLESALTERLLLELASLVATTRAHRP